MTLDDDDVRALLTVSSGFVITAARQCDHYNLYKPVHVVVDTSDADGDIPSFLTGFEHARLMGLSKTDVKILARCTGSNQARMSEAAGKRKRRVADGDESVSLFPSCRNGVDHALFVTIALKSYPIRLACHDEV